MENINITEQVEKIVLEENITEYVEVSPSIINVAELLSGGDMLKAVYDKQNKQLDIFDEIAKKQNTLVSNVNIKSINGESILGGGDIEIEAVVTEQAIIDALGFNVLDEIVKAQKEIAGLVTFDFTAEAGNTHNIDLIEDYSGKTLDIQSFMDDNVTITVNNSIAINQPITIRKTGLFNLKLVGATTDVRILSNSTETVAGIDEVDLTSTELYNTVQIMKESNDRFWGLGI